MITCNIAATHSKDGDDGLFSERVPERLSTCLDVDWEGLQGSFQLINEGDWRREVAHQMLNTRGWVFQERFLSPRIMHFAADQVYWDCYESTASEVSQMSWKYVSRSYEMCPKQYTQILQPETPRDQVYMWENMVKTYSTS